MKPVQFEDYLTGINNRMGLYHEYDKLGDTLTSLLFLDIDNFKTVNDVYGHKKGDEVLVRISEIIVNNTPDNAIIARLGGDEFVAVITGNSTKEYITSIVLKILEDIRWCKKKDKVFDVISGSVGIAVNLDSKKGLDDILGKADKAMYFAKEKGKDTYAFFEECENKIKYEKEIVKDVINAIDEGRILVKYHPIMHLQSSRIVSTEACCLLKRSNGIILGRNDFRPILVKNKLIHSIDMFVYEQVCKDYIKYKDINNKRNKICVQFSHLLLIDDEKIAELLKVTKEYGLQTESIELNFDESIFSGRTVVSLLIENIKKLNSYGFSISLSHFGEDCSRVKYLKELPLSKVKLDNEFMAECLEDEKGLRTLKGIINLGKGFNYTVVASHVENAEDALLLSECGCDAATGDFFSEMIDIDQYVKFLEDNISENPETVSFRFNNNLKADKGNIEGKIIGENVNFTDGINDEWRALSFPGGPSATNYLSLPPVFPKDDYTVSMWIKQRESQDWVSALYVRYQGGFASFMPVVKGGRSIYRINEDAHLDVWHDAITKALNDDEWNFVAATYDSFAAIIRLYINGELCATISGVPNMGEAKEVWIGGDVFQNSFCSLISAVQFSNVTMESVEIKEMYDKIKGECNQGHA